MKGRLSKKPVTLGVCLFLCLTLSAVLAIRGDSIQTVVMRFYIGSATYYVNDKASEMETVPEIKNGSSFLPAAHVVRPLGGQMSWDGNEKKATIIFEDKKIELWIGKNTVLVNGKSKLIDSSNTEAVPYISSGATMVPVRFAAENFGCKLEWDGQLQEIKLIYPDPDTISIGATWTEKTDMPTNRADLGVVELKDRIYAVGGKDYYTDGSKTVLEEYDPASDSWTKKKGMRQNRWGFGTSVLNEKIYVMGGVQVGCLDIVEEYDIKTDVWTTKKSMNVKRAGLESVSLDGKIYAIGGYDGKDYLGVVEEYDPSTDTWTIKSSMPTPRSELSAAALNGKIYAIGGRNEAGEGLGVVEEYDPTQDTWITKKSMPTERSSMAVAENNEKIHVMGGWNKRCLRTVEIYNPENDEWSENPSLIVGRHGLGAAVSGNRIYAVGGNSFYAGGILNKVEEFTISN